MINFSTQKKSYYSKGHTFETCNSIGTTRTRDSWIWHQTLLYGSSYDTLKRHDPGAWRVRAVPPARSAEPPTRCRSWPQRAPDFPFCLHRFLSTKRARICAGASCHVPRWGSLPARGIPSHTQRQNATLSSTLPAPAANSPQGGCASAPTPDLPAPLTNPTQPNPPPPPPPRGTAASPLAAPSGGRTRPPRPRPRRLHPGTQVPPFPFRSARRRHLPGAAPLSTCGARPRCRGGRPPRSAAAAESPERPPPGGAAAAAPLPPRARARTPLARSNGRRAAPQWSARRCRWRAGGAGRGGAARAGRAEARSPRRRRWWGAGAGGGGSQPGQPLGARQPRLPSNGPGKSGLRLLPPSLSPSLRPSVRPWGSLFPSARPATGG